MSNFQRLLLDNLELGIWYDVYPNQGTGGKELPEWFHHNQTNAMATIRPMVHVGLLRIRKADLGLPQVCVGEPI
jgi:hypothetical protein